MMLPQIPWIEWIATLAVGITSLSRMRHIRMVSMIALVLAVAAGVLGTAGGFFIIPAAGAVAAFFASAQRLWFSLVARMTAAATAFFAAIVFWVFPVPVAPTPGGPFKVGTRIIEIPDNGMENPKLVVQIWYPTRDSDGERARWLPDSALAPRFPFHRIGYAKALATSDAPIIAHSVPWPVIFYEHAWLGHRNENVAQLQDLASRGFVIVATDHPGQAKRVLYQDWTVINGALRPVPDFSSAASITSFESEAKTLMTKRSLEIERVRTALASGLVPDLDGKVRWTRMGVFGFSFGGTTSIQLCAGDSGFIAGANQDGLYLDVGEPRGPFLFFDQEMPKWLLEPAGASESAEQIMIRRAENRIKHAMAATGRLRKILPGTVHASFTDRKFLSPLQIVSRTGNRPADEVHDDIMSPLATFFQENLRDLKTLPSLK